jgi:cell wall-associated NlpC family hydrolase
MPRTPTSTALHRRGLAGVLLTLGLLTGACVGPAPSGGPRPAANAAAVVAFAENQVGKPYCFAGAGPTCYDCSGLTMRAWQAGGITLPHFSGSQYTMFPSVSLTQLQPGDLVFPADPNQHVALYVGGGLIIHATHTGDVIRKVPINQPGLGLVLAVRPG